MGRAGLGRCLMSKGCQHVITGPFGPAMVHIMDHSIFRRADILRKVEPMDLIFYEKKFFGFFGIITKRALSV